MVRYLDLTRSGREWRHGWQLPPASTYLSTTTNRSAMFFSRATTSGGAQQLATRSGDGVMTTSRSGGWRVHEWWRPTSGGPTSSATREIHESRPMTHKHIAHGSRPKPMIRLLQQLVQICHGREWMVAPVASIACAGDDDTTPNKSTYKSATGKNCMFRPDLGCSKSNLFDPNHDFPSKSAMMFWHRII